MKNYNDEDPFVGICFVRIDNKIVFHNNHFCKQNSEELTIGKSVAPIIKYEEEADTNDKRCNLQ